jgi:hypothetical protein
MNETAQYEVPKDGVAMDSTCVFTWFREGAQKEKIIERQKEYPLHVKGAYSNGTVSFFIREEDVGISVRIDHLLQFLNAAKTAAVEAIENADETPS